MIRYREFAISAASLAAMSLSSGCTDIGNLHGDWSGSALITSGGSTYALPFSWTGSVSQQSFFGGTATSDYTEFTRDMSISVDKDSVGTLQTSMSKVYTYTYDYGDGSDPYVADVDFSYARTYSGAATKVGQRQFDIVMDNTSDDTKIVINGSDQSPSSDTTDSPTTQSKVLQCFTDGSELHCFDGSSNLMIFTQQ